MEKIEARIEIKLQFFGIHQKILILRKKDQLLFMSMEVLLLFLMQKCFNMMLVLTQL